ncbi:hypothetical protein J6590_035940 [Homalodisca vitripennis]|nr:hypothetical protein J6590_035940 [Homalodisca vitripennis]
MMFPIFQIVEANWNILESLFVQIRPWTSIRGRDSASDCFDSLTNNRLNYAAVSLVTMNGMYVYGRRTAVLYPVRARPTLPAAHTARAANFGATKYRTRIVLLSGGFDGLKRLPGMWALGKLSVYLEDRTRGHFHIFTSSVLQYANQTDTATKDVRDVKKLRLLTVPINTEKVTDRVCPLELNFLNKCIYFR